MKNLENLKKGLMKAIDNFFADYQADPDYGSDKKPRKREYIIECPWCGLEHSVEIYRKTLLDSPDKAFSVQCASSARSDIGCKNVIVICSQKTIEEIKKMK